MTNGRWSKLKYKQKKELLKMYKEGNPISEINKKFKCGDATLYRVLKEFDYIPRRNGVKPRTPTLELTKLKKENELKISELRSENEILIACNKGLRMSNKRLRIRPIERRVIIRKRRYDNLILIIWLMTWLFVMLNPFRYEALLIPMFPTFCMVFADMFRGGQ